MVRDGSGWFSVLRGGAYDHCRRVVTIIGAWPPLLAHGRRMPTIS